MSVQDGIRPGRQVHPRNARKGDGADGLARTAYFLVLVWTDVAHRGATGFRRLGRTALLAKTEEDKFAARVGVMWGELARRTRCCVE